MFSCTDTMIVRPFWFVKRVYGFRTSVRSLPWDSFPSPQPGIECVADAVTEQVEAEHGERDGDAGED